MRRNIRVWDSVRHAQAIGLARRIQSAAELRTRHRAWAENNKQWSTWAFKSIKQRWTKKIEKSWKINQQPIKIDAWRGSGRKLSRTSPWTRLKSRLGGILSASWPHLSGQHGSKLASQIGWKSLKNRCWKRSKIWCILGSIFGRILVDFGKVEACWHQNRIENQALRKCAKSHLELAR